MLAYHNNEEIKAEYLARVRAHRAADALIQGTGWAHGKGCAVGCTLESYDHERYPIELGIPEVLAYLEDSLFELQTPADAQQWPQRFLAAIPSGADLHGVWAAWCRWMLADPDDGVIRFVCKRQGAREAVECVLALYTMTKADPKAVIAAKELSTAAWAASGEVWATTSGATAAAAAWALASTTAAALALTSASEAATAAFAAASGHAVAAVAARGASTQATMAAAATSFKEPRASWVVKASDKLIELLVSAPLGLD